jgi:hypothetical protein
MRRSRKTRAIERVNYGARPLEFYGQEVSSRHVDRTSLDTSSVAATCLQLIAPVIKPSLVRLTPEEIEVVLPDEVIRAVDHIALDHGVPRRRKDRVGLIRD